MDFIDSFRTNFEHVELVTSDYVLWEFYGHFRDEFYVRKLVKDLNYGFVSANKQCVRGGYSKVDLPEMEKFGNEIDALVLKFADNPVSIEPLISRPREGFQEWMQMVLKLSKFSYKDAIVFVSAVFTNSSLIITLDGPFSCDGDLKELKDALSSLKTPLKIDLAFKKPIDFANVKAINSNYKNWFIERNEGKVIGKVIETWAKGTIVAVECLKDNFIQIDDYLCTVSFDANNACNMNVFDVKEKNLRDYDTEQGITKGKKVTIKIDSKKIRVTNGASVFLYESL